MTEFTERHHAYIAAQFYKFLKERHGGQGLDVFVMATRRYAEQRGSRMAQRALRDGRKLTFSTYREYGEWTNSPAVTAQGAGNKSETLAESPDYVMKITACPWAAQFADMGMSECGALYCSHVDSSLARGFNPDIKYEVLCSLNDSDSCIHILRGAGLLPPPGARNAANMREFDYHCGHIYKTFSEITKAVLGDSQIAADVMIVFCGNYGAGMGAQLAALAKEDFNLI